MLLLLATSNLKSNLKDDRDDFGNLALNLDLKSSTLKSTYQLITKRKVMTLNTKVIKERKKRSDHEQRSNRDIKRERFRNHSTKNSLVHEKDTERED